MSVPSTRKRGFSKRPDARIDVLYVDGCAGQRDAVRHRLLDAGQFHVVEPDSPQELDRLLASGSFEVVLSELNPWGLGELQILERVRAVQEHLSVVILTSQGSERWAAEAIKRGAADYLPKTPDDLERLSELLIAAARRGAAAVSTNGAKRLPREEAAYSSILNALSINLAFLDQQGTIRAVNDAWKQQAFETRFQCRRRGRLGDRPGTAEPIGRPMRHVFFRVRIRRKPWPALVSAVRQPRPGQRPAGCHRRSQRHHASPTRPGRTIPAVRAVAGPVVHGRV
jgi:DNA-binding NarL/FixJ family response regulator